jgi:dephospho-CoA kinase
MKVIGVTGGIGSGKSTAAEILAQLGAVVIDADRVGHDVYRPGSVGWDRVVAQFGREIVAEDGGIDRRRLGSIVFTDSARLAQLNAIVHPLIREAVAARIAAERAAARAPAVVVEAALLVEAGWHTLVDEVWVITAAPALVEERLVRQRGLAPAAVAARMRAQLADAERIAHAAVVVENTGSLDELRTRLTAAWRARVLGT